MNDNLAALDALSSKIAELKELFPNRKLLVVREDFVAVFERAHLGKEGVEIVVKPCKSDSNTMIVSWHPADYSILVEAAEFMEAKTAVKVALPAANAHAELQAG